MNQIVSVGAARDRDRREELRRVDLRASLAMAVAVVMAAGLIAAMTGRAWAPSYGDPVLAWLWWAGCVSWAVSVAVQVLALMPRLGPVRPRPYRSGAVLDPARRGRTAGAVLRKYRLVRVGVLALAVATTLFAASGLR